MATETWTNDGLKKKYAELAEEHERVNGNLSLFQQRCRDLETERATYLASHAALVRSRMPGNPIVHQTIDLKYLLIALIVQMVLLGAVLVAVVLR